MNTPRTPRTLHENTQNPESNANPNKNIIIQALNIIGNATKFGFPDDLVLIACFHVLGEVG
jgi:hypothetical protein